MKLIKFTSIIIAVLFANSILAGPAEEAIEKADKTRLEAKARGFEWSTTSILLMKAKTALAAGDNALAEKLANQAQKEGENAIIQADYAQLHWQESIPL